MSNNDIALIGHLKRRAGFGATRDEIERYAAKGYEATVEELLNPTNVQAIPEDLIRRYHADQSGMLGRDDPGSSWLYRMITTTAPLQEKMALFWHGISPPDTTRSPRANPWWTRSRCSGVMAWAVEDVVVALSKDPAMIYWLDNHDNPNEAINENFGRELLELFSMGVGNYTEGDIKECARAFTGYTIGNTEYMALRSLRDSIWPYGRIPFHTNISPKITTTGRRYSWASGADSAAKISLDIICQQPATARFISRHIYHFFVADEPPVPQWPYKPPGDPDAIDLLSQTYFDSDYDIRSMLRVMFYSDFFRSEQSWYAKVKSPAELVAGVLRLTGEYQKPKRGILEQARQMGYMGQQLLNPPSVEGWHQGTEWIDTGTLVQRLNFATQHLGDADQPGVRGMIDRIMAGGPGVIPTERLVDSCLEQMGSISVSQETRSALLKFASKGGDLPVSPTEPDEPARQRVAELLGLAAAAIEFQRS